LLKAHQVSSAYGKTEVLKNVSVTFGAGRFTAIIGPNGCGKTSLLKAIMGFLPVSKGDVFLEDKPVRDMNRRQFARRIAYLPQESHCPEYITVGELIELAGYARYSMFGGAGERDRALFRSALETVGLTDIARRKMNSLSGGQRQRAWIAMILAQDADIVLMDEPVNHLDMKYQLGILGLVRDLSARSGKTVVTVLHDLNLTTAFADDVVIMQDGEVLTAGPVAGNVTPENIARVFDLDVEVFERGNRLVCLPKLSEGQQARAC